MTDKKVGPQGTTPGETDNQSQTDAGSHSTNGDGGGTSPEADVRLFFDVLYRDGTGFVHVVYGKDPYRNDKGKIRFRIWSRKTPRTGMRSPTRRMPTPPPPRSWTCPRPVSTSMWPPP